MRRMKTRRRRMWTTRENVEKDMEEDKEKEEDDEDV